MTIEGSVKFIYETKTVGYPQYHEAYPDMIDDQTITMEVPSVEMNVYQYFNLFNSFLRAVGFDELNIMQGAVGLAFSDMRKDEDMRKVAEEHDLIMAEDIAKIVQDKLKQDVEWVEKHEDSWEKRYWALYHSVNNKYNSQYTDEELDAMCDKASSDQEKEKCQEYNLRESEYYNKNSMKAWNGLTPGSPESVSHGCKCPVMDNEEMPDDRKWVNADCPIHGKKQ